MEKQAIDRRQVLRIGLIGTLIASATALAGCAADADYQALRRSGGNHDKPGGKGGPGGN